MSFYHKISFFILASFFFTQAQASMFFGTKQEAEKPELVVWQKEVEIDKMLTAAQKDQQQSIMLENEWNELLCDTMLEKLNRTVTSFGKWGLRQSLHPVADKSALQVWQQQLHALADNEELYATIKSALTNINDGEDALLAYHNTTNELHNSVKRCYYYEPSSEFLKPYFAPLNKSKTALDAAVFVDLAKCGASAALMFGAIAFLSNLHAPNAEMIRRMQEHFNSIKTYYEDKEMFAAAEVPWAPASDPLKVHETQWSLLNAPIQQESFLSGFKDSVLSPIISHLPFVWRFRDDALRKAMQAHPNNYENSNQNSLGDLVLLYKEGFGYYKPFAWLATLGGVAVRDFHLLSVGTYLSLYLKPLFTGPSALKVELVKVARIFSALESIVVAARNNEALQESPYIKNLAGLFDADNAENSESMRSLIAQMREFNIGNQSVVWSRGRILLLHKLLLELKEDLIPCLQDIAHLDALMSIATLLKESTSNRPWSYATFVDEKHPKIEASSFWLPLVHTDHVVLNSIKMGGAAQGKVVLTGPNGGGKSTIMKAMAYQIIFAQSWGIVPSHDTHMSIFTGLRTALNPQEDMKRGLSTFMAQKQRMDQMSAFIRNATSQDTYFVLVDEPYRGTVEIESQKRVMGFANDIALYDQVMLMMATHFEKPTQLAQTLPVYYANYQCEFIKTAEGFLDRTYRLLPGAALWWFHDEAMRGLYIDCLECAGKIEQ